MIWFKKLVIATTLSFLTSTAVAKTTMNIATDSGVKGSPSGDAVEKWARLIEEGTDGALKFRIFYQNQLGGQQDVFDQHIAGDVQMMLNWPMTSYDRRLSVIYTPYMFMTWEAAMEAYQPGGWLNKTVDSIYQDNGLKFFGAWPEGFNGVATRGNYPSTIDEAEKVKVRVPPVFPFVETIKSMGFQTVSIDWGEIYAALQTGVVDGDAANILYHDYEYLRDVLDNYARTKQQFITGVLSMNLEAWESLSPEHQEIVQEAALEIMTDQFNSARDTDSEVVEKWKALNKVYIEPNIDEISALAAKVRSEVWPLIEKEVGADIMNEISENSVQIED